MDKKQGEVFTTKKGTILPLLDLRGKEYLEVKYRIVWFREEHPDWQIVTQFVRLEDNFAIAKAEIRNEAGVLMATSHKAENTKGFADFMEKAETGAIGRALALVGYGTQFCADELDEGKRIVDSPATPVTKTKFDNFQTTTPFTAPVIKPNVSTVNVVQTSPAVEKWKPSKEQLSSVFEKLQPMGYDTKEKAAAYCKKITKKDHSSEWTKEDLFQVEASLVTDLLDNDANEDLA